MLGYVSKDLYDEGYGMSISKRELELINFFSFGLQDYIARAYPIEKN